MNTVRGESSNFFVHVFVVVVVFCCCCCKTQKHKLLEHTKNLYQHKKEKKSEIFFSLFLLCERGVLDKIQSKKRKSLYNAHAPLTLSKTIG